MKFSNQKVSTDWRNICRSNNYLWIKEMFSLQIEELSAFRSESGTSIHFTDQRIFYRSKNYLHIIQISSDWLTICRLKNFICSLNKICGLKIYLQIEFNLWINELSVDWKTICRSKKYLLQCRPKNYT